MPNRSSKTGVKKDFAETAFRVMQEATGQIVPPEQPVKNPAAVELGRLGGLKGGKARAESLSAKKRKEIAVKAAKIRWSKTT